MDIEKTVDGNCLTVKLKGRLDTITSPKFEGELKNSLQFIKELNLDFKELVYLSSAGLRVILFAQKQMNKQGKMIIKNVNPMIMEVFEITGFTDILTLE